MCPLPPGMCMSSDLHITTPILTVFTSFPSPFPPLLLPFIISYPDRQTCSQFHGTELCCTTWKSTHLACGNLFSPRAEREASLASLVLSRLFLLYRRSLVWFSFCSAKGHSSELYTYLPPLNDLTRPYIAATVASFTSPFFILFNYSRCHPGHLV